MTHERDDVAWGRAARVEDGVIRFLQQAAPETGWRADTALFGDGQLDSFVLVNLVLWVEEQIRARIDPAVFDLQKEWGTVAGIVAFIMRHDARAADRDDPRS